MANPLGELTGVILYPMGERPLGKNATANGDLKKLWNF
jgi:hypothetical protein